MLLQHRFLLKKLELVNKLCIIQFTGHVKVSTSTFWLIEIDAYPFPTSGIQ